jgi:hypothetical protein
LLLAALLVVLAIPLTTAWLLIIRLLPELPAIIRDAPPLALVALLLALAATMGLALFVVLKLLRQLRLFFSGWRANASMTDEQKQSLGKRWLCLTHRLDEPLNGLSASLNAPIQAVPRMGGPSPGYLSLRRLLHPFAALNDRLFAPLADAFVWDTGIARLQGRDLPGVTMVSCGAAPPELAFRFRSLPAGIQAAMSQQADRSSSLTAQRVREALQRFGSGEAGAENLASAISWNEVLHTSYFENAGIVSACAAFIAGKAGQDTDRSLAWWFEGETETKPHPRASAFEPHRLYWAGVLIAAGLAAIVSFAGFASYQAWIAPFTRGQQIETVIVNMKKSQFTRLWEDPLPGGVLLRIAALGRSSDAIEALPQIRNPNTRIMAAEQIAYATGFLGDKAAFDALVKQELAAMGGGQTLSDVEALLLAFALSGANRSESALASPLSDALAEKIKANEGLIIADEEAVLMAAQSLLDSGNPAPIDQLLNAILPLSCEKVLAFMASSGFRRQSGVATAEFDECLSRPPANPAASNEATTPQPAGTVALPVNSPAALFASGDIAALARTIEAWDETAEQESKISLGDGDLLNYRRAFIEKGFRAAQERIENVYVSRLRETMDDQSLYPLEHLRRVSEFAEGLLAIGRRDELARVAGEMNSAASSEAMFSIVEAQNMAASAVMWKALGDQARADASLRLIIAKRSGLGGNGFPFMMRLAEMWEASNPPLAFAAAEYAVELFEDAFEIDSLSDYSRTITDAVELFARLGEYRLARETAERVGHRLGAYEPPVEQATETSEYDVRAEKNVLLGSGVLGGYTALLEAELRRTAPKDIPFILDHRDKWPAPVGIFNTSFNRG